MDKVNHEIPPIYDERSKILILGSFPSVKSRENNFFYHHPQNRFWKVLAQILKEDLPNTIEEKKSLLLKNNIALWDVIASCEIEGSSDSSIRNVVPNDIGNILKNTEILEIYANGAKAYSLYQKYMYPVCKREAVKLPSTSPANAAFSLERLEQEWGIMKKNLK